MALIEERRRAIQTGVAPRQIVRILNGAVGRKIAQTLAEGIVRGPGQAARKLLAKLNLETVVAAPAGIIHVGESAGRVRVHHEEVDRIDARRIVLLRGRGLNARLRARAEAA